ncbi:MAG: TonB-dependent receptor [Polaromonas sp.]|uniref:TonB-dependent receptor n=1 Tax=Polaromonas sp. TaxID=1869339 RepID=UPI0027375015|nr:TonB-dependent receptor [Polaromonas sp.]MDP2819965.1 TonB-dependent receptor [Polaromonas sp.]
MKKSFPRSAIGTATLSLLALGSTSVLAQTPAPTLKEITVTGNPLGSTDLIAPATRYSGDGLLLRSKTTLGETLDGTPGVSSTYFGPNASRPIIRGLDGDRIRILANGGGSLDASSLSYDHAVTSDPLSIERIEVLRGPGALLYGGSAVGGVVNVIDNRIPREAQFDENGGISGKVDINAATGNSERGKGVLLEAGNQRYSLHVDAFDRQTSDVRVPRDLACTKTAVTTTARRICNSASDVSGGAVGGSVFFDSGYLGASASNYRSSYGTVAEDRVTIGMKSDRYALEGEIRNLDGPLQSIKAQYSQTDYRHTEFEGPRPGTVFTNKGSDFRLEARHAKIGNIDGVLGVQTESSRFSAVGTEAFAPFSKTSQSALFAYEELGTAWGKMSLGGRLESVHVESLGNPRVARFTPAKKEFKPGSYALGALWNAAPGWQMTSNLAYTERAPKDYELFADGPHIATAAYEVGNANLAKEQSSNLDLGAAWKSGGHSFKVNTYVSRFKNYIALNQTTGVRRNAEDGEVNPTEDPGNAGFTASGAAFRPLAEFRYQQVRARFTGIEASGNIRLQEGASTVDLALRGDVVRATNLSNGQSLPRIAPWRVGASLLWASGPWGASVGFDHLAAQKRVSAPPVGVTQAYTLWNATSSYRMKAGPASLLWYARLDNITDKLAYSATSVLTSTAFPKAPLPGRSLKVGLQASF